jgi:hypothetical protein
MVAAIPSSKGKCLLQSGTTIGQVGFYSVFALGLASCRDTSLCLLIGVGLRLLQMWWPSSYRGGSLLGIGSWIARKASL